MKLIRILRPKDVQSSEIAERIERAPGGAISELYLATETDGHVAFIILDWWPNQSYAVLYELFVDPSCRNRGVGSTVLRKAEAIARRRGATSLRLTPCPLAPEIQPAMLEAWYEKRGYARLPDDANGMFAKDLRPRKSSRLTPVNLFNLATEFLEASKREFKASEAPVSFAGYFLAGRAMELALKSYLLFTGSDEPRLRSIGHNLTKAFDAALGAGLDQYGGLRQDDRSLIEWTNLYYEVKDLEYPTTGFKSYPDHHVLLDCVHRVTQCLAIPMRAWRPADAAAQQDPASD